MATYRLGGGAPIRVARATCEVKLMVDPQCAWEVVVSSKDNPMLGKQDGVLMQRDGTTIIRPVTKSISIALQAPVNQVFPVGTRVRGFVSFHTERGREPVEVQVESLDLGGLRHAVLFVMHPEEGQYRLDTVGAQPSSPLSNGAKSSAFVVRGLHGGASADRTVTADLSVLLDDSPSMLRWWKNGSLLAVLETLAGMDHELGNRDALDVCVGSGGSWDPVAAHDFATVLARTNPSGPRLEVAGVLWPAHSHRLIVSDTVPHPVPADVAVLLMCEPAAVRQLMAVHGNTAVVVVPGGLAGVPAALGDSRRRELEDFVKNVMDVLRRIDEQEV